MDDNSDIAFLAASLDKEMSIRFQGSPDANNMRQQRTDWRNFLKPAHSSQHAPHLQYPQHGPTNYPPQLVQHFPPAHTPVNQQSNIPVDPIIPNNNVAVQNINQIPLPQGFVQPQNIHGKMESMDSFNVPNYNNSGKNYLEDEEEFRDALIKEVKAQKKNINKLLREMESLKIMIKTLLDAQSPSEPLNIEVISKDDTPTES